MTGPHLHDRFPELRVTLHFTRTKAHTVACAPWLIARPRAGRRPPLILPAGGSSPVGALGDVETALELAEQCRAGT